MQVEFRESFAYEASDYVDHLEVDFDGIPCVVSAGQVRGIASKMLIGARRVFWRLFIFAQLSKLADP